jgi:hypothetical protein
MLQRTLAPLLALIVAAAAIGCASDSEDTTTPREAPSGPLVGRSVEFALDVDALDHATMDAIAKRIEQQTAAESVNIEVRKSSDDGTTVVINAWGRSAIADDALSADLRAQFPALKNAIISINALEGEGPTHGLADLEIDQDEDPEVVKRQVTEQLRAKGVQGDVQVHIDDHDDGKREVRVEVKDEEHLIAPK